MKLKIYIFVIIVLFGEITGRFLGQTLDTQTRTSLTLSSVNSDNVAQRTYETARNMIRPALLLVYLGLGLALFLPPKNSTPKTETNQ